eukprot:TRINITY_DN5886_c0_g2_i2.p1 TRINITY_DN5886_c0_g2~~TRINITY_DN5886_c0_g2_i2.p1  ORF type:complete len:114 (+),score=18.99 TRINITY_DN5886_c0_g2_i2:35-376(+)
MEEKGRTSIYKTQEKNSKQARGNKDDRQKNGKRHHRCFIDALEAEIARRIGDRLEEMRIRKQPNRSKKKQQRKQSDEEIVKNGASDQRSTQTTRTRRYNAKTTNDQGNKKRTP